MTPAERIAFREAISPRCTIIAELKLVSPFGWENHECGRDWRHALEICEEIGSIISVHTNPFWGGSFNHLENVRRQTKLPILAKGFHPTIFDVRKAFDAGADYCLTVGWWPGDNRCWHECERLEELTETGADWAVWNSRDPRTGKARIFGMASAEMYRTGKLCQASRINGIESVHPRAKAVLIGEGLYSSANA